MSLEIKQVKTDKHNIYQRELMDKRIIPHHPSISLFSGSAGSGKSTLVANLLTSPLMYCGYFDAIFLLIGSLDDIYDDLIEKKIINKNHVIENPEIPDLQKIIDMQKMAITKAGNISKSPKILVIMDDLANNKKLLSSKPFLQLFVAGRHLNSSTWFLSQYLNLTPKNCRMQCNYLMLFKCNRSEMQLIYEQYCPPGLDKKEFNKIIMETTADSKNSDGSKKINFMMICKAGAENQKFRRNLDEFIVLDGQETPELKYSANIDIDAEKQMKKEIEQTINKNVQVEQQQMIMKPIQQKKKYIMDR